MLCTYYLFTIVVYNTPAAVYTSTVSLVLIESTIIITSSTAMCCSYTTTIIKSPEVSTSIPNTTNSSGEGEAIQTDKI